MCHGLRKGDVMDGIRGNLTGLQEAIVASDLDCIIATSPENFTYTTDTVVWTQKMGRLAVAIIPREGIPSILVAEQEKGYVSQQSWIQEVHSYVAHGPSPLSSLKEILSEKGLATGRIGVEAGFFKTSEYAELTAALPEAELVNSRPIFDKLRVIKTPEEVNLLKFGAVATERALLATYATIRPGDRERSVAGRIAGNMLQNGADLPAFLFLTIGANTGHAHSSPTEYLAELGDLVKSDVGAYFSGYFSDVARTAVLGGASVEQRSLYERLYEVHSETLASIRPGVPVKEVFQVATEGYKRVKIPFPFSFAGHGIGLSAHEGPLLGADDETILAPQMVLAVETRVRWPGQAGYHIEDMVCVTETGLEVWTQDMETRRLMEI